ncbi:PREDICTED: carboxyl-terminal peptidase [Prunus dulcis]|uniref:PREDICTED: carboxyl-terminal peptidase n=1 Tax=Prunus dulcis TaxID=3755 RepID=A0A5E4GA96_PRUDU|nr:PREDICTED: carboxyl-terminal peptidase [Prunus dulcis]
MGSGHFPEEGYRKSAYIRQIKVVTDRSQDYVDPEDDDLKMYIDKPYCYNGRQDLYKLAPVCLQASSYPFPLIRIGQQGIGGSCLKTNTLATGKNQIFISLKQGASCFSWGGEVYSQPTYLSPPMGSGHFPKEGYEKAVYITQIKVVINESAGYGDPPVDPRRLKISAAKPYCYNVI